MNPSDITDFIGITDTKKSQAVEPEKGKFDRDELGPRKVLMTWEGKPKASVTQLDPRYIKTITVIAVVIVFILLLMKEYSLILVVASLFFISRQISKNPLEKFKYEISTHGINISGQMYYWDEMVRFFFAQHFGDEYLAVDLKEGIPSRIIMGFKRGDREKIVETLNKYVQYLEEEPLNFVDRAYKSVIDKFDLEKKK